MEACGKAGRHYPHCKIVYSGSIPDVASSNQIKALCRTLWAPLEVPAKWLGAPSAGSLNPKHPDRDDGGEHGNTADRPARHISRAVVWLRSIDHGVAPMVHDSLQEKFLEIFSPLIGLVGEGGRRFKQGLQVRGLFPLLRSSEALHWTQFLSRRCPNLGGG